jgi:ABC-type uncharacterized transport system substrate-binding protein
MRRREFLTILSGAAVVPLIWPDHAHAQQPRNSPTIGFLGTTTPTIWSANVTAFQNRLRELDWMEGRNVSIEYRWAQGRDDRYAEFAGEFAQRKVDIIVTAGTTAVLALKKATSTIPIVFAAAGDPVRTGLVNSLSRPGGNVTGLSNLQTDLGGRRLALLREIVPSVQRVAVLGNTESPLIALEMEGVKEDGAKLGLETFKLEVTKAEEIVPGLQALNGVADALYICSDPFLPRIGFASIPWRSPRNCRHKRLSGICRSRRSVLLRTQFSGPVQTIRRLRRQDFARCEAGRHPGRAAGQVRPCRQQHDGESDRSDHSRTVPAARQRSD